MERRHPGGPCLILPANDAGKMPALPEVASTAIPTQFALMLTDEYRAKRATRRARFAKFDGPSAGEMRVFDPAPQHIAQIAKVLDSKAS